MSGYNEELGLTEDEIQEQEYLEQLRQEEQHRYAIVTHEMAIDAGMLEIEGQSFRW